MCAARAPPSPLLTLGTPPRVQLHYSLLQSVFMLASRCPGVFEEEYKQFFCRYNEPTYVKYVKLDIVPYLATEANVADIVAELR